MRHKWFVFWAGISLGVPLLTLIFHDWDKFLPDEWFPYVHTFYAPDGTKQYKEGSAFTKAWLLHQNRNKHHWQFWMITWDRGTTECLPMPLKYRREMLADWIGAGKALGFPKTWEWYEKNKNNIQIHPDTRLWLEPELDKLKAKFLSKREALADIQHDIWAHWMQWVFKICPENEDGAVTIPAELVNRWRRQIETTYTDLTEKEKDSDREQADKVLSVLKS